MSPEAAKSFAGLLSAMIAGKKPAAKDDSHDDGQIDDVATLSYEDALRRHARYRPEPVQVPEKQPMLWADEELRETIRKVAGDGPRKAPPAGEADTAAAAEAGPQKTPAGRKLMTASVTIRLSRAERVQLERRAAEAGLTVSAYLRSCAFEVDTLRGMVKQTMAQLKAASPEKKPPMPERHGFGERLGRVITPWRVSHGAA